MASEQPSAPGAPAPDAPAPDAKGPKTILSPEQRVLAKEAAVLQTMAILDIISRKFGDINISQKEFDLRGWLSTLEHIRNDHKGFRFRVGLAGDTGMGKTSLLNVLVSDDGDIAPSSQNGACTAAVCYFKYHEPPSADMKYLARIRLKSANSVEQELSTLFHDIKEVDDRVQSEGSEDAIARSEIDRFKTRLQIICGWSGLDYDTVEKHSKCASSGPLAILRGCVDATTLFDFRNPTKTKVLHIFASKPAEFLRLVKVYAGATSRNTTLRWPLTEHIEVKLPSALLQRCPGLVLTDLPGEMDAIDARSQVAREHYHKLDNVMIVTPADRARDNKTAADLLRDDTLCDMEAKGQLDDNSLAVVISKVDQLQWKEYVLNEVDPALISAEFPAMWKEFNDTEAEIEDTDDMQLQLALEQKLEELACRCMRACLDSRAQETNAALQQYFAGVRMLRKHTVHGGANLSVFSVSSKAQRALARGTPMECFPDDHATGVAGVVDWIVQGSLPKRERQAENILFRCQVLFDAIDAWVGETNVPDFRPMPDDDLAVIEAKVQNLMANLDSHFKSAERRLKGNITRRIHQAMRSEHPDVVRSLETKLPDVVRGFRYAGGSQLHWATYGACLRRKGSNFRTSCKPQRTICWQAQLHVFYWVKRSETWSDEFTKRIPEHVNSMLDKQAQSAISTLIHSLTDPKTFPASFIDAIRPIAYRFENYLRTYQVYVRQALADFNTEVLDARQLTRTAMCAEMDEAFETALELTGKGKTAKQASYLEDFAKEHATHIVDRANAAVKKKLEEAKGRLHARISKHRPQLYKGIQNYTAKMLERLSSQQQAMNLAPSSDESTLAVKESLQDELETWKTLWADLKQKIPDISFQLTDKSIAAKILADLEKNCEDGDGGYDGEGKPAKTRKKPGPKPGYKRKPKAADATDTAKRQKTVASASSGVPEIKQEGAEAVVKEEPEDS